MAPAAAAAAAAAGVIRPVAQRAHPLDLMVPGVVASAVAAGAEMAPQEALPVEAGAATTRVITAAIHSVCLVGQ